LLKDDGMIVQVCGNTRVTGKPEVDKLAWRHLTVPTVSDSQVCKFKSGLLQLLP